MVAYGQHVEFPAAIAWKQQLSLQISSYPNFSGCWIGSDPIHWTKIPAPTAYQDRGAGRLIKHLVKFITGKHGLWNPQIQCYIHMDPPLIPILNRINPIPRGDRGLHQEKSVPDFVCKLEIKFLKNSRTGH